MIDTLMIFAAGKGTRMQALTADLPKSLITIAGTSILHHSLTHAISYPFKKIIINSHYLHSQIHESIADFKSKHQHLKLPEIIEIYEPDLLETGGAVKNALSLLGNEPIFTLNSDVIIRSNSNVFGYLNQQWNPKLMDFLLLLQPFEKAIGYKGDGDFELLSNGQVSRVAIADHYNYMYAGLSIVKPAMIAENTARALSLKDYYLACEGVYGACVPGDGFKWYHATTPEDVQTIEQAIKND